MNILITNITLSGNSGTEMYVKELALELKRRGHCVEVFTMLIGRTGDELISEDINVVDKLKRLKNKPDIIHAHHNLVTQKAAFFFKHTPIIFFLHDRTAGFDHPFLHKNIIRYLAVDYNCRERYFLENNFIKDEIQVIFNWFNAERFSLKDHINQVPKKALFFSNYIKSGIIFNEVKDACSEAGIDLDIIGNESGRPCFKPEEILGNYDLVFGKAKAGIEAMATGACFIVCDYRGLGEMITSINMEYCRTYNFGMKLMQNPIKKELILQEIKKYDSHEIKKVSLYIRNTSNLFSIVSEI
ncbi:MAG: glycosyltransferase family 4 protein [Chitinophagaceae bacterium]